MSNLAKLAALATPAIVPPLHKRFAPAALANRAYRERVRASGRAVPLAIALERGDGSVSVYRTECFDERADGAELNLPYAERLVKFLLWQRGGWRVIVGGPRSVGEHIRASLLATAVRAPSTTTSWAAFTSIPSRWRSPTRTRFLRPPKAP